MRASRPHRVGVVILAACLAAGISAGAATIGASAGTPDVPPVAHAAAACAGSQASCQAAAQQRKQRLARLRRQNAHQKRPNVIVIETDDQNQSDMQYLPATQAILGAHGTTFRNSYVEYPLCCPSRATFLTGQYAHNHHVTTTDLPNGYNGLDHSNTLAVWLKRAKYNTAMVGKYLNGYGINDGIPEPVSDAREIPPGWTRWYALTSGSEQRRYQYKLNENGKLVFYRGGARNYVEDVLDSKANALIRKWAPYPKPFFLWFTPSAPHGQSGTPASSTRDPEPAPRYLGTAGNATAPRNPNFNENDVTDKPDQVRNQPKLSDDVINDIDRRFRGRVESLRSVDEEVARIMRLLRKTHDRRKTYIFFTSDNGLLLGAHRLEFKDFLYEEATRVPLIIRGPNIPENTVRDQLVSNIDLAPTIVQITHARPGRTMDGLSLLPLVSNTGAEANRTLLFESFDTGTFGVRQGSWAFNRYANNEEELYDLGSDPFELDNLLSGAGAATYLGIRNQLAAQLDRLKNCAGASCR
jgi:N-acetylglucosamine-6-sulfatase